MYIYIYIYIYVFTQQDNSTVGIRATLNGFAATLARVDPQVANHLESTGVKPQFYAFRWITLLLTQVCVYGKGGVGGGVEGGDVYMVDAWGCIMVY